MSVRVMSRVFDDPSIEDHGELLVMLVLADFCNDAGECWPAVGTVAKKSRIDERSVRRIFQRLLETGRLQVARGGGRETNLYRLYPTPDPGSPLTLSPPTPDLKSPHPGTRVRAPLTYGQPIRNGIIIEPSEEREVASAPPLTLVSEVLPKPKKKLEPRAKSWDDFLAFCVSRGISHKDSEYLFSHWESNGWMTGKQPIKSWKHAVITWQAGGFLPSQKPK